MTTTGTITKTKPAAKIIVAAFVVRKIITPEIIVSMASKRDPKAAVLRQRYKQDVGA